MSAELSRRAGPGEIVPGGALADGAPAHHAFAALDDRQWFFLTDDETCRLAAMVEVPVPEDRPTAAAGRPQGREEAPD